MLLWGEAVRAIRKLSDLEDGWDGLQGLAPNPGAILHAIAIAHRLKTKLPCPDQVKCSTAGTVLLIWEDEESYFEIEVINSKDADLMTIMPDGDTMHTAIEMKPSYEED
jgi:hypothetical protein